MGWDDSLQIVSVGGWGAEQRRAQLTWAAAGVDGTSEWVWAAASAVAAVAVAADLADGWEPWQGAPGSCCHAALPWSACEQLGHGTSDQG